jgi:RHS repeat-associated protein
VITNQTSQVVWRWDQSDPFGGNVANENPSGLGTFTCNLRLPGQYFDKETNLHYNYHRWYDPAIGRYTQFDLIGLAGGINGYAYAESSPLIYMDPEGLTSCNGTWRRYKWDRFSLTPGIPVPDPGRPLPKVRAFPAIACTCWWLCEHCSLPNMFDPTGAGLPTTRGFIFVNYRASRSNKGSVEVGNQCFCSPPGPETGCECNATSPDPVR